MAVWDFPLGGIGPAGEEAAPGGLFSEQSRARNMGLSPGDIDLYEGNAEGSDSGFGVLGASRIIADEMAEATAGRAGDIVAGAIDAVRSAIQLPEDFRTYSFMEVLPPDPEEVARVHARDIPVVRRPTMGLIAHQDRYAVLEVLVRSGDSRSGIPLEIYNSTFERGKADYTTNFIIQGVTEQHTDPSMLVKTLGSWYLAAIGNDPMMIQVKGVLLEAKNFPWASEFRKNFNKYLRAGQCILRRAQAYLTVDDTMYVGYITDAVLGREVTPTWEVIPFQFNMLVRADVDVRLVTLAPELENTSGINVVPNEGVFVDGIRVSTLTSNVTSARDFAERSTLSVNQLGELFNIGEIRDPFGVTDRGYLASDIMESAEYAPTQGLEIVQGSIEGLPQFVPAVLNDERTLDRRLLENNLESLVALARQLNAEAGREVFDIQNVRVSYMANQREELAALGFYDPWGPAGYGLPTAYQDEVDSRRRRMQQEALDRAERAYNRAADGEPVIEWFR